MRKIIAFLVAVGLFFGVFVGGVAATSTVLEPESALEDDSDSDTVEFVFEVAGDGDVEVEITTDTFQTEDGGNVENEFLQWEALNGTDSGTGTSWTADGGEEYRVVYEATAHSGASDGNYPFEFSAEGGGAEYETTFNIDVDPLEPAFGQIDAETADVVFGADDGTASTTVAIDIENAGDGTMVPETISFDDHADIDASVESLPETIDAGSTAEAIVEIDVDDDADEGTYSLTAEIEDSLDNDATTTIDVEVFKPPVAETDPETVDMGEILIGEEGSAEIDIEEVTGRNDVDSLQVAVAGVADGDISVSELDGLSVSAGETTTAELSVTVDEDAGQGDTLEWVVELTPDAENAPTTELVVTADVIYPPYFGPLDASDTEIRFDEPRTSVDEFTHTVEVTVPNDGDLPMTDLDASASISGAGVDAEVAVVPSSIEGRSSDTVSVTVTADSETSDGTRSLSVDVESEEAGSETIETDVEIKQFPRLGVSPGSVDFGEVSISTEQTRSVAFSEELEYKDIEQLSVTLEDGPDEGWLEFDDPPAALDAGETQRVFFSIEFDADAELFVTYEWDFEIDGSDIDTRNFTVRAVPRPVECTEVVEELEAYDSDDDTANQFADRMADTIRIVEDDARDLTEGSIEDITRACTAGRGGLLMLNANDAALEADDPQTQQEHIARMAFGFDTVRQFGSELNSSEAGNAAQQGIELGDDLLDARIDAQVATLDAELEDATVLEEARVKTRLARMAEIRGETEGAVATRTEADAAFEEYLALVAAGNDDLREARDKHDDLAASLFVSVGGQSVFWIADYDEFQDRQADVLDTYDSAIEDFETAGADERAEEAATERASMADAYQNTLIFSGILAGVLGFVFLLIVLYEARGVYRYIQDIKTAKSGSSLV